MARGRFINNKIAVDKRINELSNDTSRLAFTWLITFADREGRTHGDPAVVRSMLFPRRDDIDIDLMESFIREWHDAGLIAWYVAKGDQWIYFKQFEQNQVGLRKDREAPSEIPAPPVETPEEVRSDAGVDTDQIPVKLREVKLREEEGLPLPQTPLDAEKHPVLQIFNLVTDRMPGRNDYKTAIDTVSLIRRKFESDVDAIEYMKKFWLAWDGRKNSKGKPYRKSSLAWLTEWAINNDIPPAYNSDGSVSVQEKLESEGYEYRRAD